MSHADITAMARAAARTNARQRVQQQAELVAELAAAGTTDAAIAIRLGVTKDTVERYRRRAGIYHATPRGATMPQYQHDPDWILTRTDRDARPSVGADGFVENLGPVYAGDLTDAQKRHIGLVAAGILVGQDAGTPDTLQAVLEALGVLDYDAPSRLATGKIAGETGWDRARKAAERRAAS